MSRRKANPLAVTAVLALTLVVTCTARATATTENDLEYQVKAAFLYNFAKFVEWPEDAFATADAPFVFCIVGTDPFGDSLEKTVSGRRARNRDIVVRRGPDLEGLGRCHLVFIGASEDDDVARHLRDASRQPALTVGESAAFSRGGGMIRLLVDDKRMQFDINQEPAEKSRLNISSQLLKLARQIEH